ncbi:hypothetical protein EPI10_022115 [Gossypium australe]|uniref:Uncharacterized protein n=1 Tax=Gossypium australe TaxID=47621 RepID=A0A5B6WL33_9ROSI|nr:hypothetical protein EPI10_022115 [Gossypium australe]
MEDEQWNRKEVRPISIPKQSKKLQPKEDKLVDDVEAQDHFLIPIKDAILETIQLLLAIVAQNYWKAPRAWYNRIDEHFLQLDDLLVTGSNDEFVQKFKEICNILSRWQTWEKRFIFWKRKSNKSNIKC